MSLHPGNRVLRGMRHVEKDKKNKRGSHHVPIYCNWFRRWRPTRRPRPHHDHPASSGMFSTRWLMSPARLFLPSFSWKLFLFFVRVVFILFFWITVIESTESNHVKGGYPSFHFISSSFKSPSCWPIMPAQHRHGLIGSGLPILFGFQFSYLSIHP